MQIGKNVLIIRDNKFPYVHLITGDKIFDHAFAEATDDTLRRAKSSIEELAIEYAAAEKNNNRATCVIIEHILSTRLLKVQTNTALITTGITVCATLGATILGYFLGVGNPCP